MDPTAIDPTAGPSAAFESEENYAGHVGGRRKSGSSQGSRKSGSSQGDAKPNFRRAHEINPNDEDDPNAAAAAAATAAAAMMKKKGRRASISMVFGQFKNMFITSQHRQHASHTLASRAYGP